MISSPESPSPITVLPSTRQKVLMKITQYLKYISLKLKEYMVKVRYNGRYNI